MYCKDCTKHDECDKKDELQLCPDDLWELYYEPNVEGTCKNFKKKKDKIKMKFWLLLILELTFICLISIATATKGITVMTLQFWVILLSSLGMRVIGFFEGRMGK